MNTKHPAPGVPLAVVDAVNAECRRVEALAHLLAAGGDLEAKHAVGVGEVLQDVADRLRAILTPA